jgi:hypothetical protein
VAVAYGVWRERFVAVPAAEQSCIRIDIRGRRVRNVNAARTCVRTSPPEEADELVFAASGALHKPPSAVGNVVLTGDPEVVDARPADAADHTQRGWSREPSLDDRYCLGWK